MITIIIRSAKKGAFKMSDTPRIYVADLAAYNSGLLRGVWVNCDQSSDLIQSEIDEMLEKSPIPNAEEWRIDDCEFFNGVNVTTLGIEEIARIVELFDAHGKDLVLGLISHFGDHYLDECIKSLDEDYQGGYKSIEDWADQYLDDSGQLDQIPKNLRCYFDYEKFARDCELGGDIFTIEDNSGNVHVFWNR
jgi:antirestriction protein